MDSLDFYASWKNQKKIWVGSLKNWLSLFGFESFTIQIQFQAKSVPTQRAPDAGDSGAFSSIFLASSFSCSQAASTPAHTQVTQTVGWQSQKANTKPSLIRRFHFFDWLRNSYSFFSSFFCSTAFAIIMFEEKCPKNIGKL